MVQLRHSIAHLANATGLFDRCRADLPDQVRHALHLRDDVDHRRAGAPPPAPSRPRPSGRWHRSVVLISLAASALRCARLRTSAATTAKPRPCSPARAASTAAFSARMLVWNAMPSMTPMMSAIFLERRGDVVHRGDHLVHHVAALGGRSAGRTGQLIGLFRGVGVVLDGGGQLLHRRGGLLQVRRLLLGALRQIGIAGGDLGGAGRDGIGGRAHLAHQAGQALLHSRPARRAGCRQRRPRYRHCG